MLVCANFEHSHCTHSSATHVPTVAPWPKCRFRHTHRPLEPLSLHRLGRTARAASLLVTQSPASTSYVAAAALHRPGCCRWHAAAASRRCIAHPSSSRCSAASGGARSRHPARRWRRIAPLLTCSPGGSKTPSPAPQRMKMSAQNVAATRRASRPASVLGLGHAEAPVYARTSDRKPSSDSV